MSRGLPGIGAHILADSVRAIGKPTLWNSKTRYRSGTKFRVGMDDRNFFFEGQWGKQILPPYFKRLIRIEIWRRIGGMHHLNVHDYDQQRCSNDAEKLIFHAT